MTVLRSDRAVAGAVFGVADIPARWTSVLHGRVPGHGEHRWDLADLHRLAGAMDGRPASNVALEEDR